MKLGFVTAIVPELSFRQVLALARDEGFDCIEVMCWPVGKAERKYAGVTHIDVTNISQAQMEELPINGRNWQDLGMLALGNRVNGVGTNEIAAEGSGTYQVNVDGQQVTAKQIELAAQHDELAMHGFERFEVVFAKVGNGLEILLDILGPPLDKAHRAPLRPLRFQPARIAQPHPVGRGEIAHPRALGHGIGRNGYQPGSMGIDLGVQIRPRATTCRRIVGRRRKRKASNHWVAGFSGLRGSMRGAG